MANLSEDIQCAGSDTRPPMLDRTDFASWQQRIRLYCRVKDNGVNILKSIDEGPYKLGTFRETLAKSTEGTPQFDPLALLSNVSNTQHGSPSSSTSSFTQLPPPRANSSSPANDLIENLTSTLALLTQSYRTFLPQTNNQLRASSNLRNQATVQDGRVVVQNVQGRPNRGQEMNPWGGNDAGYGEAKNRVRNVNQGQARPGQARTVKCYNCNDEAPTAQTMFMANLSSVDPITDEAGPFYDSDILSEVQDHDHYLDDTCAYQEEHVMHDSVQLDHVVDLHADYTSVSNMILYDQYVKDNEVPVVHNNASSIQNDSV
nr:integrase, catalytic region, zinc finger, CCHC-type, peptidase aspartic, catalytic [Tanacetum cinerariifolium]